ncbi:tetratricopeptide repeat protein [Frankia nepalensis]|uniref:tetratricopeptide repeat protein n=1 Tax=Frankia nepalensis TaxID=1836974 RepID=UPI003899506B
MNLFEDVLTDQVRVLGNDHRGTLATQHNLAQVYRAAGQIDEAVSLFEDVLTIQLRVLGADHPLTLAAREALDLARRGQDAAP